MLGHGYHAADYHGSMKQPIYQTSTYEFPNAQAGKNYFAWATGKEEMPEDLIQDLHAALNRII